MYITPILPTDVNSNIDEELLLLSEKVCIESAKLTAAHNEHLLYSVREVLRTINSYYSNKIESEGTHPVDIEKAMKKEFSQDSKKRALQKLSLSYIETQKTIENLDSGEIVYSKEFIQNIHRKFYSADGMEDFLKVNHNGQDMVPGEIRDYDVEVNNYVAPSHEKLKAMFNEFEALYKHNISSTTKAKRLLYALSAHHRLLYMHPFADGNGRTSRLFLDALLLNMDLEGYGLWNISRGLARDAQSYADHLKHADTIRQGATDGRGVLSSRGLGYYIKYMLEMALDQIKYMNDNLKMETLGERIENFVKLSQANMLGVEPLPKYSDQLFKELLIKGKIPRGNVQNIIGTKDRTASSLINTLIKMEYIYSDTPRGDIKLKLNSFFASKIIPNLIPDVN